VDCRADDGIRQVVSQMRASVEKTAS
jgi:hypothetical protein